MPAALTIDLKGSRKYKPEDRETIQHYVIGITELFNTIYRPSLLKELHFSGGDEIQGLFTGISAAYICLRLFRRMVFPIEIHAGIGDGEWTTVIPDRDTFYQDGPAYHNAREAIEYAKSERDYIALMSSGYGRNVCWNAMMNAGFQLAEKNTLYQNELAILLECIYPICTGEIIYPDMLIKLEKPLLEKRGLPVFTKETKKERAPLISNSFPEYNRKAMAEMWKSDTRKDYFIYKYAHPYSAATVLAKATGTKRQSIDTALKASNVYAERAIALAILEETQKL